MHHPTQGSPAKNVSLDDWRVCFNTLPPVHRWPRWKLVLGHELLLLTCSRCCRKRGGGWGSHHIGPQPLDHLTACSLDTLEHEVCSRDTIFLERLVWAMYDNVMGPGKSPTLSGFESYGQVLWCLVDKAYKGWQMHCPAGTSTSFNTEEKVKVKSVVIVPEKPVKPQRYSLTRDMWEEFTGAYSAMKDKHKFMGGNQATEECVQPLNLSNSGLKMDERAPALVHGWAAGFLAATLVPDWWWQGIKLTPGPQTFVCVALGIGLGPQYARLCPHCLTLAIGCRKTARKMIDNVG